MKLAINAWFLTQAGTGSGQYLQNLLKAIPAQAPDLEILLVAPAGRLGDMPESTMEVWPLQDGPLRGSAGKVWFEQVTFPRACRKWGADLAHVPYWGSPLQPAVPTVVTVHDLIPLLLPAYRGGPLVRLYTSLVATSARQAAIVLTDSLASKHDIEQHLGLPDSAVRCIYLAVGEQFSPEPNPGDESIRRHYALPQRYVLYLAGHDRRKNVRRLVEAFSIVARANDDVTLAIGGRLPQKQDPLFFDPRPLIETLGLEDKVQLLGWVEEEHKPALYRGAACAVFASEYEGFGLPVLEALACGTPLVTSNSSSLPELVGDAGFAISPGNVQELSGAILSCLVDEALAAELRLRGPEQAAKFSWARMAQETIAVYREVASCAS